MATSKKNTKKPEETGRNKNKVNPRLQKLLKFKGVLSKPGYEATKEEWYEQ
jgi:hypothetical protein